MANSYPCRGYVLSVLGLIFSGPKSFQHLLQIYCRCGKINVRPSSTLRYLSIWGEVWFVAYFMTIGISYTPCRWNTVTNCHRGDCLSTKNNLHFSSSVFFFGIVHTPSGAGRTRSSGTDRQRFQRDWCVSHSRLPRFVEAVERHRRNRSSKRIFHQIIAEG